MHCHWLTSHKETFRAYIVKLLILNTPKRNVIKLEKRHPSLLRNHRKRAAYFLRAADVEAAAAKLPDIFLRA
tara:strand:+ start:956 stop:1171 length:216 start_codon:yes stop_codon:yes gene_type:complete